MNVVRIAICQIETHPAVYLSHIAYLEEPFVPIARDVCLSHFATRGIEVHDIQQQCRDEYLRWAEQRLYAVLGELSRLTPPPGLVLFPETAIPIEHLPSLAKWSSENSAVILAGTHTPLSTTEAKKIYRQLGIDSGQVNQLTQKSRRSELPQFVSGKL